ncbi:hypothetical protein KIF53_04700 [Chromobacterium subtsugae]|uniref:TIGR02285 family protein n=1 Tax=Chromobacterium subtsugae TaxID=251747 RepID=A0ABS7FA09_9NEIS|nr:MULTISPECIES: hypothetical protein [Chromobacterium]KUM02058.1 hypothetical protein Cv017_05115 [Chromobacterium subtsugae]KZE87031.1 hypothetical protein AWB61_11770 [Chromobacterium sp. F49]MBW7566037.1 hypothetical protein [Chromobacterium subtsugae]MBW8286923.1 hypothetical protein [Chromobacterium subtsugae]WSE93003.1 hypothetical protein U6115_07105 [Chromobacterium subtsugae]
MLKATVGKKPTTSFRTFIGVGMALCHLTMSADARADDNTIRWQMPGNPPVTITDGPDKGQGYADVFLRYFIERAPEYNSVIERASLARVSGLMKQGEHVCQPSLLKTVEREAYMEFSDPVEFVLPYYIVMRSDRTARLKAYRDADGAIDIARLMHDLSLTTVRQEMRGYPPVVLSAFTAAAGQKNILQTSADDVGPFSQLASGWVDYIIAYPDEVYWFARHLKLPTSIKFVYFPIAGHPKYTIGYAACTKGAWGRKIVKRVNEIVAKAGRRPPWIDAEARLLDPEAAKRYEEVYARYSPFRRQAD